LAELHPWIAKLFGRYQRTSSEMLDREIVLLRDYRGDLTALGFTASVDQVDRIVSYFNTGKLSFSRYLELRGQLQDRIQDDLQHGRFFMIPQHKVAYYTGASTLLGTDVNAAFPSAQPDVEHASKCFAFDRNTAVVFHLMRVMEVGLRALAASLNDPKLDPKKNPNWGAILRKCDEELRKPLGDRCSEWQKQARTCGPSRMHGETQQCTSNGNTTRKRPRMRFMPWALSCVSSRQDYMINRLPEVRAAVQSGFGQGHPWKEEALKKGSPLRQSHNVAVGYPRDRPA